MTAPSPENRALIEDIKSILRASLSNHDMAAQCIVNLIARSEARHHNTEGEWVTVPREITLDMQRAYFDVVDKNLRRVETDAAFGRYASQKQAYAAMLAAAPVPPHNTEGEAVAAWAFEYLHDNGEHDEPSWEPTATILDPRRHKRPAFQYRNVRPLYAHPSATPDLAGLRGEVEKVRDFADQVLEAATNCCTDPDGGEDDETSVRSTGRA
jgi:hypothetical protein